MDHSAHEPGTVAECLDCQALAVEPGWYKALRDERVTGKPPDSILLPDATEVEVLTDESGDGVSVPELEQTRPDDNG